METDTFFISYKKYNSIKINLYIKYNLVTFSIYILNVEKGVVKIHELQISSTVELKQCNV